jgi:hypothetical protein
MLLPAGRVIHSHGVGKIASDATTVASGAIICHVGVMKLIVPLVTVLLLAGCSQENDVAFYRDNPAERGKRVSECDTYKDASKDCENARQAMAEIYAEQAEKHAAKAADADNGAVAAPVK